MIGESRREPLLESLAPLSDSEIDGLAIFALRLLLGDN